VGPLIAPVVEELGWHAVEDAGAAGVARRVAVDAAQRLGFADQRLGELTIVATEITSNLYKHADRGRVGIRCLRAESLGAVELVAIDEGPGMADAVLSARDGHSTAGTLGIGLGAIARLSNRVDGYSLPGRGTVLTAQLWPDAATPAQVAVEGLSRPLTGERVCGDRFAVRPHEGGLLLMVADGLGHGPLAAAASSAAADVFRGSSLGSPAAIIEHLHKTISYTRGAAISVARLAGTAVQFAGLGNVAGAIAWPNGERRGLVSMPGIVGHQLRQIREFDYQMDADAVLIMHSDGVSERWNLGNYPGLPRRAPLTVAATLLRDGGQRRDDACVLVAKAAV
jgi:anti-sigma regulatory factor (Ser/Thr protein kinase)